MECSLPATREKSCAISFIQSNACLPPLLVMAMTSSLKTQSQAKKTSSFLQFINVSLLVSALWLVHQDFLISLFLAF